MSMNERKEDFFDKNDARLADSEGAPDGELSQDELNNVSGGGKSYAKNPEGFAKNSEGLRKFQDDDKSDASIS